MTPFTVVLSLIEKHTMSALPNYLIFNALSLFCCLTFHYHNASPRYPNCFYFSNYLLYKSPHFMTITKSSICLPTISFYFNSDNKYAFLIFFPIAFFLFLLTQSTILSSMFSIHLKQLEQPPNPCVSFLK